MPVSSFASLARLALLALIVAFVGTPVVVAQAPQQRPRGIPPIPADKEPVVTTETGLKYSVLTKGKEGASPKFGDKVKVNYTGWNLDGSVVDSSRPDGKPADMTIGEVIDGFSEALQMMTPGAHWKLTIPPELGYGRTGSPPVIKPNATLVFELELVSFEKGVDLPPFRAGDAAKQRKTESGMVYEPVVESTNAPPRAEDVLELKVAMWNTKGRLVFCTELNPRYLFKGRAMDMPVRVLQVAPQYVPVGARYRFEVPFELCKNAPGFGAPYLPAGSTTVWEIEVVSAKEAKIPPFVKPDPGDQITTASGLKYEVLKEGSGPKADPKQTVVVHYAGWFTDGTPFDSSHQRGEPYTMRSPWSVIPGWIEALQLMSAGAVYRLEIPGKLAYGARGRPPKIPPDATLVFELEVIQVGG